MFVALRSEFGIQAVWFGTVRGVQLLEPLEGSVLRVVRGAGLFRTAG